MDIATLNQTVEVLTRELEQAQDRYNLHPSNAGIEGQVIGICAAIMKVKGMLNKELEHRNTTQ